MRCYYLGEFATIKAAAPEAAEASQTSARMSTSPTHATYPNRRGPIAAEYNSPGPAYGLPKLVGQKEHDPRSTKPRGPAYSFGIRHAAFTSESSPGPCYLPNSKYSNKGPSGEPHYSIYGRTKGLDSTENVPGPGEYDVTKATMQVYPTGPRAPIGFRQDERRVDQTPGPNAYGLPTTLGRNIKSNMNSAPVYSLRSRTKQGDFAEDLAKTPGPCAYTVVSADVYKHRPPQFSLASRTRSVGDVSGKPGPDTYKHETQFYNIKKKMPSFSFGLRHSQYSGTLITEADAS